MEDNKIITDCINIKCEADLHRSCFTALEGYALFGGDKELRKKCEELIDIRTKSAIADRDMLWKMGGVSAKVTVLRNGYHGDYHNDAIDEAYEGDASIWYEHDV